MAPLGEVIARNPDAFSKLRLYSLLLFSAGLGAFFLFRSERVAAMLGVSTSPGRDALGAIAGVLATNAVIALYIVSAFREPDEPVAGAPTGAPTTLTPKETKGE